MSKTMRDAAVGEIFVFWQQEMGKPQAKLTPGRKTKIAARLKTHTADDLKRAILGCRASAFHMGVNDSNTLYNSCELIFRNDEKVEFFMEKAGMPSPTSPKPIMDRLSDRAWANEPVVVDTGVIEHVGEVGDMFR